MSIYLICGSRDCPDMWFVRQKIIDLVPAGEVILTGGARGVDRYADYVARTWGYRRKVMEADWEMHGKGAGYIRNLQMLGEHPVAVLAFQYQHSRGTAHTIREAQRRGILVHQFTEDDL